MLRAVDRSQTISQISRQVRLCRRHRTAAVRRSYGYLAGHDVRNLIVGKENRSILTAAARQPCGRRVISQDCRRAAAKKSQNILATRKVCKAVMRRPYVVCAFIVRSSYEFDPRGGYKCNDRGKHQAYIHREPDISPLGHLPPCEKWYMRTSAPQVIDRGGYLPPQQM